MDTRISKATQAFFIDLLLQSPLYAAVTVVSLYAAGASVFLSVCAALSMASWIVPTVVIWLDREEIYSDIL